MKKRKAEKMMQIMKDQNLKRIVFTVCLAVSQWSIASQLRYNLGVLDAVKSNEAKTCAVNVWDEVIKKVPLRPSAKALSLLITNLNQKLAPHGLAVCSVHMCDEKTPLRGNGIVFNVLIGERVQVAGDVRPHTLNYQPVVDIQFSL
jgi:hypothetical protein